MSNIISAFVDRHPIISIVALLLVIASVTGGMYFGIIPVGADRGTPQQAASPVSLAPGANGVSEADLNRACREKFGPDATNEGYWLSNPPVVYCNAPNGELGIMDMPEWLIEKSDYTLAEGAQ
jgi:hypothetical protein